MKIVNIATKKSKAICFFLFTRSEAGLSKNLFVAFDSVSNLLLVFFFAFALHGLPFVCLNS